jgi:hypothetical protein
MRIPCELLAAPRKIQAGHHLEDTPLSMGICYIAHRSERVIFAYLPRLSKAYLQKPTPGAGKPLR